MPRRRKVGRPKGSKNKKRTTRRRKTPAQLGAGFFGDLARTLVPIVSKEVIPAVSRRVLGGRGLSPPGLGLKLAGRGHPRRKPRYTPYYTRTPRGRYVYK